MKVEKSRRRLLQASALLTFTSALPFAYAQQSNRVENRLAELGIELPPVPAPVVDQSIIFGVVDFTENEAPLFVDW